MSGRNSISAFTHHAWRRVPDRVWPKSRLDAWRRNRALSPVEPNPSAPDRLEAFLLFAVIGTYAEGDVIESTVANAFAQGCDRVFLVDNGSPDDTVERATSAGAERGHRLHDLRLRRNASLGPHQRMDRRSASKSSDAHHIWWLLIDADEFPEAPDHPRLRDFLASLDRRFRVVGARFLNHFPTTPLTTSPDATRSTSRSSR